MKKISKTLEKYVCKPVHLHLNPLAESMYLCTYVLNLYIWAREERKICKCLILVLLMRKEEKYVKSVQQITTNFSQFMSTKANNWKKKSSKSPGMITPYFKNEGLRISKQKWKVEFLMIRELRRAKFEQQTWTTT